MSEPPRSSARQAPSSSPVNEPPPVRRSRWWSLFRIGIEFALLFAIALAGRQALMALGSGSYPNPLWLPVIVLSLQHGMAAGIGAAVLAAAIQHWEGLPPALLGEDMYSYIGRIAAEPVGWCCVALLIGHIRSRQLKNLADLETELAERTRQCAAVADLCAELRRRTELLERHIAANAHASNNDIAEAMAALNQANWEDFPERLTRFVTLMTGAADFSIYVLRNNSLDLVFQPEDDHRLTSTAAVPSDDPVFAAVVNEQRLISAADTAENVLLRSRWIVAGPLLSVPCPAPRSAEPSVAGAERVSGMFAISGAALEDLPDDVARRFSLTCAEISRLLGRIALMERWNTAQTPRQGNGRDLSSSPSRAAESGYPSPQHGSVAGATGRTRQRA